MVLIPPCGVSVCIEKVRPKYLVFTMVVKGKIVVVHKHSVSAISTLLQKHCNKKQETEECILKLCGYIYHQGTYTPQAGSEKGAGVLPFTGVNALLLKTCHSGQYPLEGCKNKKPRNVI